MIAGIGGYRCQGADFRVRLLRQHIAGSMRREADRTELHVRHQVRFAQQPPHITGATGGHVYDVNGKVLLDVNGNPFVANTPDANSLLKVEGAPATDKGGNPFYLVIHFEYVSTDSSAPPKDLYGKAPMVMKLSTLDQNKRNGALSVVALRNMNMAGIRGLWIPCAGSLPPWNTHLGSEEYEPTARPLRKTAPSMKPFVITPSFSRPPPENCPNH